MNALTSPKNTLLLEADLEVLHEQSQEWLSEVEFWRDELAFYYALFIEKTHDSVPVNSKNIVLDLEKELPKMFHSELNDLSTRVQEHETFLGTLMEHRSLNDKAFRAKHRQLSLEFSDFERRVKNVKKEAFALIKLSKNAS